MALLIVDKENNQQVVVSSAEMNTKNAPLFSGAGRLQDPQKFLNEFNKAARWNNWMTDDRKKEIFDLCLEGAAERWIENLKNKNAITFKTMPFDDGKEESVVGYFKKKFVTDYWTENYIRQYEEYRQRLNETPLEYLETKQYLLKRANLPSVYQFCDKVIKDPYRSEIQTSLSTIDGLEKLLLWDEQCLYTSYKLGDLKTEHVLPIPQNYPQTVYLILKKPQENKEARGDKILEALGEIQNDLALMKDQIGHLENQKPVYKALKCKNCNEEGHFRRNFVKPCKNCTTKDHVPKDCPRFTKRNSAQVNHIDADEEDQDFCRSSPLEH
ncbi:hypothetical protein BD560DRAFT_441933 [Blakeslea trispora]|nr:hypothetical protein BD560DRAFT_441933 [Blakeslea trispora]